MEERASTHLAFPAMAHAARRLGETFGRDIPAPGWAGCAATGPHSAQPGLDSMTPLLGTLLLFLGSAVVIYLACEYFVNGVEWSGHRFDFGH